MTDRETGNEPARRGFLRALFRKPGVALGEMTWSRRQQSSAKRPPSERPADRHTVQFSLADLFMVLTATALVLSAFVARRGCPPGLATVMLVLGAWILHYRIKKAIGRTRYYSLTALVLLHAAGGICGAVLGCVVVLLVVGTLGACGCRIAAIPFVQAGAVGGAVLGLAYPRATSWIIGGFGP